MAAEEIRIESFPVGVITEEQSEDLDKWLHANGFGSIGQYQWTMKDGTVITTIGASVDVWTATDLINRIILHRLYGDDMFVEPKAEESEEKLDEAPIQLIEPQSIDSALVTPFSTI